MEKKNFYKKVFLIALPIIIQQLVSSSFHIIDSMMLSGFNNAIGGVGLATQISNFVITVIFGFNVGIGIYISQFFGKKDEENIKNTFALMMLCCFVISLISSFLCSFFAESLIKIFKPSSNDALRVGTDYLKIAAFSFIPNFLSFSFSIGYRNIQKTKIPLYVSIVSLFSNLILNYVLIFGKLGLPRLEIKGAAIATLISTTISLILYIIVGLKNKEIFMPKLHNFKEAIKKSFNLPIFKRCVSFVGNELFFAIGMMIIVRLYNYFGSDSYDAVKISENFYQLFIVAATGISTATSSLIGEKLGSDDYDGAKIYAKRFIIIGIIVSSILGAICIIFAPLLVRLYDVENQFIIETSISLLMVYGIKIILRTFVVILFAIFRASGKSRFILILDSGVLYLISIPLCLLSIYYFNVDSIFTFSIILLFELVARIIIGLTYFFKANWQENITY